MLPATQAQISYIKFRLLNEYINPGIQAAIFGGRIGWESPINQILKAEDKNATKLVTIRALTRSQVQAIINHLNSNLTAPKL